MRLALVAALVVAAAAAFGGYFWVTKHERISQPELQAKVAEDQGAKSVRCTEHTSNGSVWWCAGLVHKRSVCWLIQVSVRGKVTIGIGGNRCRKDSELAALMGRDSRIDKPTVQKAVAQSRSAKRVTCVSRSKNDAVWWCAGVVRGVGHCWVVKLPPSDVLQVRPGATRCQKVAQLRRIANARA